MCFDETDKVSNKVQCCTPLSLEHHIHFYKLIKESDFFLSASDNWVKGIYNLPQPRILIIIIIWMRKKQVFLTTAVGMGHFKTWCMKKSLKNLTRWSQKLCIMTMNNLSNECDGIFCLFLYILMFHNYWRELCHFIII